MPDPTHPAVPSALTDGPQADAMAPPEGAELVERTTKDVDPDDMFTNGDA